MKSVGSVESGWKYFLMAYQTAPPTNITSMKGDTRGRSIWKIRMFGSATNPSTPLRAKTSRCFHTACKIPKDQRKRWRMRPFALMGASVKARA